MNYLIEFEYLAEETDELSVSKGDIVTDIRKSEDGWLEGVLRGKRGVFPSNFGKVIHAENNNIANSTNSDAHLSHEIEEKKMMDVIDEAKPQSKKVMGVGFGDIFSGKQIQLKHTIMSESKPQIIEDHQKTETNLDKVVSESVGKAELVKAIFVYKAENSDELQIEEGDIITILDKKSKDEGWWKGKLNNKVGVFPNNFVEPYNAEEVAKQQKPMVMKKNAPPAPLTAKPNVYKPKTTPSPNRTPNSEPVKDMARNISVKNVEPESEEINFDAPINHKPLVGPTIERVRRPNIRLPKNFAQVNSSDDTAHSTETNKITLPTEKLNEPLPLENSITKANINKKSLTLNREKSDENTSSEVKSSISKTGTLKDRFTEIVPIESQTKFVPLKDKSKEVVVLGLSSKIKAPQDWPKETTVVSGSSETVSDIKVHFRPKSQYCSSSFLKDHEDQDDLKVVALELKVIALEQNNTFLRKEFDEIYRTAFDQINDLTYTVNKLMESFEDEKAKRLHLEDLVEDLKAKVDQS